MSSKCLLFECKYNKPILKQKCLGKKRSHGKIGKRKRQQVSGRCILGALKRSELCGFDEE